MTQRGLKIAMLGHKRIPSREGGIEVVVEQLAVRLVKRGCQVTCYNRAGQHISGKEYGGSQSKEYRGVRLKRVWTVDKRGLAAMTASLSAAFLAALGRYDAVHFHAEGPCAMLWLPKLFGKRCVATIHGLDWQRAKWGGFASKYIHFGEKMAVKHADEIIVLSKNVQEYFRKTYGRETRFIPNGVEKPAVLPPDEITRRFGLRKDDYCLFLGRVVPEKGVHYLIEAWKKVKTDKKLVIAGSASDTAGYYQELKSSASDRVIFTGFVQGTLLEELYSNAYLYCLPSDLEGMPLSLLEAMSYGNCCVVSDIPECAEVVEKHAAVFPKGNAEALSALLQNLLDHEETVNAYKKAASDFICEKYNWERVTDETLALYRRNQK